MEATRLALMLNMAADQPAPRTPLKEDQVVRFLDALEDLIDRVGRVDIQQPVAGEHAEVFYQVLAEHRFDARQWSALATRIFQALAHLQMAETGVEAKLNEALAEIREDPNLEPTQKNQLQTMIAEQQRKLAAQPESPDSTAIAPYRKRLSELTGIA